MVADDDHGAQFKPAVTHKPSVWWVNTTPRPPWQWAGSLCYSRSCNNHGQGTTWEHGSHQESQYCLETPWRPGFHQYHLYLNKEYVEYGLRALHHRLAQSGSAHLEAVSQWSGGVRGCKTLRCNSPSLEPVFGFFKHQVRMVMAKASMSLLGALMPLHTQELCAKRWPSHVPGVMQFHQPELVECPDLWWTVGKATAMIRTPGKLSRLTPSSGETRCKRPNISLWVTSTALSCRIRATLVPHSAP